LQFIAFFGQRFPRVPELSIRELINIELEGKAGFSKKTKKKELKKNYFKRLL
jgi:hypothetical protein